MGKNFDAFKKLMNSSDPSMDDIFNGTVRVSPEYTIKYSSTELSLAPPINNISRVIKLSTLVPYMQFFALARSSGDPLTTNSNCLIIRNYQFYAEKLTLEEDTQLRFIMTSANAPKITNTTALIKMKDEWGKTLLHHAMENGHYELATDILNIDPNIAIMDDKGATVLDIALQSIHGIYCLIENGVVSHKMFQERLDGQKPIPPITQAYVKRIIHRIGNGPNDLHQAIDKIANCSAEGNRKQLIHKAIELIDSHPEQINQYNQKGETPLINAISNRIPEITLALIEKGADVNLENAMDYSPLRFAIEGNEDGIISALLKHQPLLERESEKDIHGSALNKNAPPDSNMMRCAIEQENLTSIAMLWAAFVENDIDIDDSWFDAVKSAEILTAKASYNNLNWAIAAKDYDAIRSIVENDDELLVNDKADTVMQAIKAQDLTEVSILLVCFIKYDKPLAMKSWIEEAKKSGFDEISKAFSKYSQLNWAIAAKDYDFMKELLEDGELAKQQKDIKNSDAADAKYVFPISTDPFIQATSCKDIDAIKILLASSEQRQDDPLAQIDKCLDFAKEHKIREMTDVLKQTRSGMVEASRKKTLEAQTQRTLEQLKKTKVEAESVAKKKREDIQQQEKETNEKIKDITSQSTVALHQIAHGALLYVCNTYIDSIYLGLPLSTLLGATSALLPTSSKEYEGLQQKQIALIALVSASTNLTLSTLHNQLLDPYLTQALATSTLDAIQKQALHAALCIIGTSVLLYLSSYLSSNAMMPSPLPNSVE